MAHLCCIFITHLLVVRNIIEGNIFPEYGDTIDTMPLKTDCPNGKGFKNKNNSSYFDNFFHPDVNSLVLIIKHMKAITTPAYIINELSV